MNGKIVKVSGPLVIAKNLPGIKMYDVVKVGEPQLIGEVIELKDEFVSIQVYENTAGIGPGEPVISTGHPLSVELGPGLIASIYDGVQRPLDKIKAAAGDFVVRGVELPSLDREKKWHFKPVVKIGQDLEEGDIIGEVEETPLIIHKIMVPVGIKGKVKKIEEGEYTVEEPVCILSTLNGEKELIMLQKWPVRIERPYKEKLPPTESLITGTRVIDTFFPVAKGGTACIPGPFGSGKTVVQHQLAKWSDAQIIVYIGCGERGNEMADVLLEFPVLKDPYSGRYLIERTVLIANTSNMPVAAREASVYTGVTIAEYFRDMGYNVSLMADSTSRWAEAMREMSSRLEEMPGEEGYPAYLASRIASFYERSGKVKCLGKDNREGSLTIVGAVSPPGGDLSDPVVQATLRMVKVFWSLEDKLAYQRHFPAINWLNSYSLYLDNIKEERAEKIAPDFLSLRNEAIKILQQEDFLAEIVRLVGLEALSPQERLIMDTAKSLREDFLNQHAFDPQDTYTFLKIQYRMLKAIMKLYHLELEAIKKGIDLDNLLHLKVKENIARMRYQDKEEFFDKIEEEIENEINQLGEK